MVKSSRSGKNVKGGLFDGVSVGTIGQIAAYKAGKQYRISEKQLDDFIKNR